MDLRTFAKRSGLAMNIAGFVLSVTAGVNTAAAQTAVVVKNTPAQSIPITGYVVASTRPDTEAVQIDLVASFSYTDVAPKGSFTIPRARSFMLSMFPRIAPQLLPRCHRTLLCGSALARTALLAGLWSQGSSSPTPVSAERCSGQSHCRCEALSRVPSGLTVSEQ